MDSRNKSASDDLFWNILSSSLPDLFRPSTAGRFGTHRPHFSGTIEFAPGMKQGRHGHDRPRPDPDRSHPQRAGRDLRADEHHHLAHQPLDRGARDARLLDRAVRRRGPQHRAGDAPSRAPELDGDLSRGHPGEIRALRAMARRRRGGHQRSLQRRPAPAGYPRLPSGVRRRRGGRHRRHAVPPYRRRRPVGRQLRRAGDGDLPGGPAHPAGEAVRRRRAQRPALQGDAVQQPRAGQAGRRPVLAVRRARCRRGGGDAHRPALRRGDAQGRHRANPRSVGAGDAGRHRGHAGRRLRVRGLRRRRRHHRDAAEDQGDADDRRRPGQGRLRRVEQAGGRLDQLHPQHGEIGGLFRAV